MKKIIYLLLLAIMPFPCIIQAQTVVIDGELRPRTEYRDGYSSPLLGTNDPGVFTSQRTRLGLTFKSGILTTQLTVQDSRIFGQYGNSSTTATTNVYEAWAEMVLIPGGSLKLGRQTLKYDDGRLFAAPAWSLTGTTHDMALFKYSVNDFMINLGAAYNNDTETSFETLYSNTDKYRALGLLWVSTPTVSGLNLTGICTVEGVQDTTGIGTSYKKFSMYKAATFGGNLKFENAGSPFSALATAYFQAGRNNVGNKLRGKLLAVKANYAITTQVTASLGTDYFSGDKNGTSDKIQSNFKKLYGANHSFNGYMDYWTTPLTQGLLDYYATVKAKVSKTLALEGGYHIFNSEYSGKNKKGVSFGRNLGSELDLLATYKLNTWTSLQAGYCAYFKTDNLLIAKNIATSTTMPHTRFPQFCYLMFTITPTFLDSGKDAVK